MWNRANTKTRRQKGGLKKRKEVGRPKPQGRKEGRQNSDPINPAKVPRQGKEIRRGAAGGKKDQVGEGGGPPFRHQDQITTCEHD